MPAVRAYPGVYIEEIPSGVRTIVGVSTSITAFLGRALSGPVNQPTTINSYGDFERIFGGLWLNSTLGYAVRDFFLNGGSQAVIVRLYNPNFSAAERTNATTLGTQLASAIAELDAPPNLVTAVAGVISTAQSAPGYSGYSQVVKDAFIKMAAVATAAAAISGADPATVATAVTASLTTAVPVARSRMTIKTQLDNNAAGTSITLEAKQEGAYTANLSVEVSTLDGDISAGVVARYGLAANDWRNVVIKNGTTVVEKFNNVSLKSSERQLDKVLENESDWLRVIGTLPTGHLDATTGAGYSPYSVLGTGGTVAVDGSDLSAYDVVGNQAQKTGIYALDNAELVNLLCIPPLTSGAALPDTVLATAIAYCQARRAIMLIDPPWAKVSDALAGIETAVGSASPNAAIFFPRLKQPNPLRGDQIESFVPCGAVAGVIARTDAARGVWKAPAGLDAVLSGVPQLEADINDQESGKLNQKGINALRSMPAAGRVIWGARTRVGADRLASEWKYLSVRRLALYIEESLYRGTQWAVFQPNDEPLWSQLRLNVGTFMQDLFRQGAFKGQSAREAYFVRCDSSTTTQSDINQGVVNIVVGFAPVKPAEFVIITLQQMAGQSST